MEIKKIFVIGAGTMGNGIAQTAAVSGYEVTIMDVFEPALEKAKSTIEKSLLSTTKNGFVSFKTFNLQLLSVII